MSEQFVSNAGPKSFAGHHINNNRLVDTYPVGRSVTFSKAHYFIMIEGGLNGIGKDETQIAPSDTGLLTPNLV